MAIRIKSILPSKYPIPVQGTDKYAYVSRQHWDIMRMYCWRLDEKGKIRSGYLSESVKLSKEVLKLHRSQCFSTANMAMIAAEPVDIGYIDGDPFNCTIENLCEDNRHVTLQWGDQLMLLSNRDALRADPDNIMAVHQRVSNSFCRGRNIRYINGNWNDIRRSNILLTNAPVIDPKLGFITDQGMKINHHMLFISSQDEIDYSRPRYPDVLYAQLLLAMHFNRMIDKSEYTHINGNPLDCRLSNFRFFPSPPTQEQKRKKWRKRFVINTIAEEIEYIYRGYQSDSILTRYLDLGYHLPAVGELLCQSYSLARHSIGNIPINEHCYSKCEIKHHPQDDGCYYNTNLFFYIYCIMQQMEEISMLVAEYFIPGIVNIIAQYALPAQERADGTERIEHGFRYTRERYDALSPPDRHYYELFVSAIDMDPTWYIHRDYDEYEKKYGRVDILDEGGKQILEKLLSIAAQPEYGYGANEHKVLVESLMLDAPRTGTKMMKILGHIAGWSKIDLRRSNVYVALAICEGSLRRDWGYGKKMVEYDHRNQPEGDDHVLFMVTPDGIFGIVF